MVKTDILEVVKIENTLQKKYFTQNVKVLEVSIQEKHVTNLLRFSLLLIMIYRCFTIEKVYVRQVEASER